MTHPDFTPDLNQISNRGSFRFWCQKVLPLVYDDSLSYYELLCKVIEYLNNTMNDVRIMGGNIDALKEAYTEFQNYIFTEFDAFTAESEEKYNQFTTNITNEFNDLKTFIDTFFDELDLSEEVSDKLDEMAASGALTNLLSPLIPNLVTTWLNDNVTPVGSAVVVDNSLTIQGAAADAAATGQIKTAVSHRKEYTLSVGTINDYTNDDMDKDTRLRTPPLRAETSKISLELPVNYYAYVFTYDENGAFNDETGWYSGTQIVNVIDKGYFRLVLKKGNEGTQTPSIEEASALIIKQLGPYYSAFSEQVSLIKPIYMPDIVFEQGTLDKYGINKINAEFPGSKRMRTADYIRIVDGVPIYFDTPNTSLVYAVLYDEFFQFVNRMEYSTSNDPLILQTQGAKWLRFVIWHTDNSDVPEKELNAVRIMQPTGISQKDSLHPQNKYGGLVDGSGKLNNDNDGIYYQTRVCTDYIPILNRKVMINIPEGYQAYLFELDTNFKFIKERGWMYFNSYYGLSSETKYIRLIYKRNDEAEVGEQDIQTLNNVTITFEISTHIRKNNPLFFEPTLIAHRGASEAPENTLPAIELAIEQGFKQIEVDIQFTLDGVCVLLHDNTINRTSNGTGAIYNMTYEQALQYDFGSWKSPEYAGTKIPTLEQALLLCKKNKVTLQIDFNDANKANITYNNVADMLRIVKKCGMVSNVVLCCREFHLRYAAYLNPNIALCTGVYTDEDIQKVEDITNRVSLFVASMQNSGSITKAMIEKRHENNMLFQTWTINSQQLADSLFNNGADWLITENITP